jgi:O-antigen/teichoic acid export membrane protein
MTDTSPDRPSPGGTAESPSDRVPGWVSGNGRLGPDRGLLHELAAGSVLTIGGVIATGLLNFLVVIAVTRGFGPDGAGMFFQAVALFSILASLADLGASAGLVRSIPRFRALARIPDIRRVVAIAAWPVALIASLTAAILIILAPEVASIIGLDASEGPAAIRTLALFLPAAAVSSVALAAIRGFGTMLPYVALENVAKPVLRPILVVIALAMGVGVPGVLLAWAIPLGLILPVAALVLAASLRRLGQAPLRAEPQPTSLVSEFWRFSAPRGLAGIFQVAIVWLGVLLLGTLGSTNDAGVYGAVGRLVGLGVFAIEGVRLAIAPQISAALAENDRDGARLLYRVGTWWLMALSWPMYLTLATFGPVILQLFGPEFVRGENALFVISLAMLIGVGTGNVTVVLLMGGKSAWALVNTTLALLVNVVLNLALIPPLGMTGAAIAWAASIVVNNVVPLGQVWRLLGLDPFGRGFFIVAGLSAICFGGIGLVVRMILGPTIIGLLAFALPACALYVFLLYRFRGLLRLAAVRQALLPRRGRSGRPAPAKAEVS